MDEKEPRFHKHIKSDGAVYEHCHVKGEIPHGHHGDKYVKAKYSLRNKT